MNISEKDTIAQETQKRIEKHLSVGDTVEVCFATSLFDTKDNTTLLKYSVDAFGIVEELTLGKIWVRLTHIISISPMDIHTQEEVLEKLERYFVNSRMVFNPSVDTYCNWERHITNIIDKVK